MKTLIIESIKFYKKTIAPLWAYGLFGSFSSSCRFYPSCSDYAVDAISKHGVGKGSVKAIGRILRCNPLVKAGIDEA